MAAPGNQARQQKGIRMKNLIAILAFSAILATSAKAAENCPNPGDFLGFPFCQDSSDSGSSNDVSEPSEPSEPGGESEAEGQA